MCVFYRLCSMGTESLAGMTQYKTTYNNIGTIRLFMYISNNSTSIPTQHK